jgi:hypothetical protein
LLVIAAVILVLFLERVYEIWITRGIFDYMAVDYAIYGATAHVVRELGWSHLYDVAAITERVIQFFQPYYGVMADRLKTGPSPYPALFLLPFFVTNQFGSPAGFMVWTVVNSLIVLILTRGIIGCRRLSGTAAYLLPFTYLPIAYNLFEGQLAIMMTVGVYQFYRLAVRGDDVRAGVWLGLVLIKPQFGLLLAVVLVAKRRWKAFGGLLIAAMILGGSTVALVGIRGMSDYFDIMRQFSGFRQVPSIVNPQYMINIRGILVNVLPHSVGDDLGKLLVVFLSILLTSSLLWIWSGPWNPTSEAFSRQVLATLIVAMFTGFHNHIHGASLLVVPMLVLLNRGDESRLLQEVILLAIFAPTLVIVITGSLPLASWTLMFFMATCYGVLLIQTDRQPTLIPQIAVRDCQANVCGIRNFNWDKLPTTAIGRGMRKAPRGPAT